jgi:thermostable 8-oxoguanine DNA glycosylase
LTPQSNALKCDACIKTLKEKDFRKNDFAIEKILKNHTRFHNNKSKYLKLIKQNEKEIFQNLKTLKTPIEKKIIL